MHNHHARLRIAPVNAALISSARSRDPRLLRMRQQASSAQTVHSMQPVPIMMTGGNLTKSLPRIPKFSHSNNNNNKASRDNDEKDRDPRNRRNKEKEESKTIKSSPSMKDKTKSSFKTSSRPNDRKKSGSSDDSSPRKKSEEEKKSKSSSHHKSSSHSRSSSSKSPAKPLSSESKDVDLRVLGCESMKPDSTTHPLATSKSSKDKLLSDLLNGEEMKSSHEPITSDNGKAYKTILAVTINVHRFIVM